MCERNGASHLSLSLSLFLSLSLSLSLSLPLSLSLSLTIYDAVCLYRDLSFNVRLSDETNTSPLEAQERIQRWGWKGKTKRGKGTSSEQREPTEGNKRKE